MVLQPIDMHSLAQSVFDGLAARSNEYALWLASDRSGRVACGSTLGKPHPGLQQQRPIVAANANSTKQWTIFDSQTVSPRSFSRHALR
jgi:hypothetical protein